MSMRFQTRRTTSTKAGVGVLTETEMRRQAKLDEIVRARAIRGLAKRRLAQIMRTLAAARHARPDATGAGK